MLAMQVGNPRFRIFRYILRLYPPHRIYVLTARSVTLLVTTALSVCSFISTRSHGPTLRVGDNCSNPYLLGTRSEEEERPWSFA
jgi:hypothetical protein